METKPKCTWWNYVRHVFSLGLTRSFPVHAFAELFPWVFTLVFTIILPILCESKSCHNTIRATMEWCCFHTDRQHSLGSFETITVIISFLLGSNSKVCYYRYHMRQVYDIIRTNNYRLEEPKRKSELVPSGRRTGGEREGGGFRIILSSCAIMAVVPLTQLCN